MYKRLIINSIKSISVSNNITSSTTTGAIRSFGSSCCSGKSTTTIPKDTEPLPLIEIDDFLKVDLRVAKVINAEHIKGSKKLLKLTLDLGIKPQTSQTITPPPLLEPINPLESLENIKLPEQPIKSIEVTSTLPLIPDEPIRDIRTVFSGIKSFYEPEALIGKNVIFVANLKPREMKFGVSEGMVLCAASDDNTKVLFTTIDPSGDAFPGMKVY